jgi:hypothetical protein
MVVKDEHLNSNVSIYNNDVTRIVKPKHRNNYALKKPSKKMAALFVIWTPTDKLISPQTSIEITFDPSLTNIFVSRARVSYQTTSLIYTGKFMYTSLLFVDAINQAAATTGGGGHPITMHCFSLPFIIIRILFSRPCFFPSLSLSLSLFSSSFFSLSFDPPLVQQ